MIVQQQWIATVSIKNEEITTPNVRLNGALQMLNRIAYVHEWRCSGLPLEERNELSHHEFLELIEFLFLDACHHLRASIQIREASAP